MTEAWLGSWVWEEVVPGPRDTARIRWPWTGLAEKRGLSAGQQTHVQDIVDEVERLGLPMIP
ncbi:hypothetical protein [Streptomyces sp. NPDC060022]|uniref:hypothetical protein n=1 Tax=Streptomyces sp. NPDC060022 TaxID=3347039 RepID=UPI0036C5D298